MPQQVQHSTQTIIFFFFLSSLLQTVKKQEVQPQEKREEGSMGDGSTLATSNTTVHLDFSPHKETPNYNKFSKICLRDQEKENEIFLENYYIQHLRAKNYQQIRSQNRFHNLLTKTHSIIKASGNII